VERGGKVVAAVTLISPYPDATLSRLEKGTLVIVINVAGSPSTLLRAVPSSVEGQLAVWR
jgi:hypothetical protein